ncbi:hypothetical protein [Candidatus Brevifilum fermentans]|jgi:hypothetical protein|nr:hypothetical protein [Brevefilum fermentans]MDI9567027.1 hypothetical protein [Chloroflexota bacterium]
MKFFKNKWSAFIILLIWIILFINLTPIILFVTGQNLQKSTVPLDLPGDQVFHAIDNLSYYGNLFQTVTLDGWVFVETKKDNPEKLVKLIFASDNVAYEIPTNLHSRRGLVNVFSEKDVPEERTGFSASFSSLGMKNGYYFLYFYVYENEDNFGLLNTNREFRKHNRGLEEYFGGELVKNEKFSKVSNTGQLLFDVNSCEIKNGYLNIYGWAFLQGVGSAKNRIFLEIQKPDSSVSYYSTKRMLREDVSEFFGDNRYLQSGFSARISLDAIGEGDNIIRFIIGGNRSNGSYEFNWANIAD